MNLLAENCKIYNGEQHPLTTVARQLVTKTSKYIEKNRENISRLENEIFNLNQDKNVENVKEEVQEIEIL